MPFGGTAASHIGSKFTADANSMAPVMEELHARGLAFLDSRPPRPARAFGSRSPTVFRTLLATSFSTTIRPSPRLPKSSREPSRWHGSAIAIGHLHDATLSALKTWLPQIEGKGLALVPVSAVVRRRMAEEAEPQH
jgi:polysaccharide deacetylase 2 family uncharacterized protein YibQ